MTDTNKLYRKLGKAATAIVDDYLSDVSPFKEHRGLTERILDDFETTRQKALFHTLVTALNYQRDAEVLYGNSVISGKTNTGFSNLSLLSKSIASKIYRTVLTTREPNGKSGCQDLVRDFTDTLSRS